MGPDLPPLVITQNRTRSSLAQTSLSLGGDRRESDLITETIAFLFVVRNLSAVAGKKKKKKRKDWICGIRCNFRSDENDPEKWWKAISA